MDRNTIQPIIELSVVIQGEGKLMGIPSLLIRTTGCPFRCDFGGSKCDTPQASYAPLMGKYSLKDVETFIADNRHINHIIITGGEPTIHLDLMNYFKHAHSDKYHITVETAGFDSISGFSLISLSPKLSSSVPKDLILAKIHNDARKRYEAMRDLMSNNRDYQLKFVITNELDIVEALELTKLIGGNQSKVWFMPAGATRSELDRSRSWLMDSCVSLGINYSDRLHIVGFNDELNK